MTALRSNSFRWKPLFRTSAVKPLKPLSRERVESGNSSAKDKGETPRLASDLATCPEWPQSPSGADTFPVLICPWENVTKEIAAPVVKKDRGILKKKRSKRKKKRGSDVAVRWPANVVEQSINPVLWCDEYSDASGSDSYRRSVNRRATGRWKEAATPINVDMPNVPFGSSTRDEDVGSVASEEPMLETESLGGSDDSFGGSDESEDEFAEVERDARENAILNKARSADPTLYPMQEKGGEEEGFGADDDSTPDEKEPVQTGDDDSSGFGSSDEDEDVPNRQQCDSPQSSGLSDGEPSQAAFAAAAASAAAPRKKERAPTGSSFGASDSDRDCDEN